MQSYRQATPLNTQLDNLTRNFNRQKQESERQYLLDIQRINESNNNDMINLINTVFMQIKQLLLPTNCSDTSLMTELHNQLLDDIDDLNSKLCSDVTQLKQSVEMAQALKKAVAILIDQFPTTTSEQKIKAINDFQELTDRNGLSTSKKHESMIGTAAAILIGVAFVACILAACGVGLVIAVVAIVPAAIFVAIGLMSEIYNEKVSAIADAGEKVSNSLHKKFHLEKQGFFASFARRLSAMTLNDRSSTPAPDTMTPVSVQLGAK